MQYARKGGAKMKYLLEIEIDSPIDQTEIIFLTLKKECNPNAIKIRRLDENEV